MITHPQPAKIRRRLLLSALICGLLAISLPSFAAPTTAPPARDWHVGFNLRTDLGSHPIRLDGGVRLGAWDAIAVVDLMAWTDGQMATDVMALHRSKSGWGWLVGWRWTRIGLADGAQNQQKLLLGCTGDLPRPARWGRASWGVELATVVVKHGGGLPTETLSFASSRSFIDLVNFGMFVRFEFWRGW